MGRHRHGDDCGCSTCKPPPPKECCKPEKPCCEVEKPCCKAKKPCCCIPGPVGPIGPRGPRGFGTNLPSGFDELEAIALVPGSGDPTNPAAPAVILSVTVDSPVARELRVTAHYSASAPGDSTPIDAAFRLRLLGVDPPAGAPNGSTETLDGNAIERREWVAGAIVRRYLSVPAGPRTVQLIASANDSGASLDPASGGAALLVEQFA